MLTLKLYPAELTGLVTFLGRINRDQLNVPLPDQPLAIAVLLAYQAKLPLSRIFRPRNPKRAYSFQLPAPVAKAFHQEMQAAPLSPDQQSLLDQIDLAITNYRSPQMDMAAARRPGYIQSQ